MKIKKFMLPIWWYNRGSFPLGNKYFGVFVLNGLWRASWSKFFVSLYAYLHKKHDNDFCFPIKSPNYFIAEAPSNPLLNLPFNFTQILCYQTKYRNFYAPHKYNKCCKAHINIPPGHPPVWSRQLEGLHSWCTQPSGLCRSAGDEKKIHEFMLGAKIVVHYLAPGASIHFSDWEGGGGGARVRKISNLI